MLEFGLLQRFFQSTNKFIADSRVPSSNNRASNGSTTELQVEADHICRNVQARRVDSQICSSTWILLTLKLTMKVAVTIAALGAASAFSNSAFTAPKRAFTPLSTLPKSGPSVEKVFFPFEESPSALKQGPNNEAEDGSAGVRQLLGVKGASAETDIWKIRLQLTKVRTSNRCYCRGRSSD